MPKGTELGSGGAGVWTQAVSGSRCPCDYTTLSQPQHGFAPAHLGTLGEGASAAGAQPRASCAPSTDSAPGPAPHISLPGPETPFYLPGLLDSHPPQPSPPQVLFIHRTSFISSDFSGENSVLLARKPVLYPEQDRTSLIRLAGLCLFRQTLGSHSRRPHPPTGQRPRAEPLTSTPATPGAASLWRVGDP